MPAGRLRFDRFDLDPVNRRLTEDGRTVDLNTRYLDALILMAAEPGQLISKTRFMDEVWRGVPVTDEALTQCIRTLRRQLGDDAARPRFIETAPKHGYRFIAPVEVVESAAPTLSSRPDLVSSPVGSGVQVEFRRLGLAGALGGGVAGLLGGLFYGMAGAAQASGSGALSILVVMICLTGALGALGGVGVTLGMATAGLASGPVWARSTLGGALGGMVVGAVVNLIGIDAFNLLFGQTPGQTTGALEGLWLGAAIGGAAALAERLISTRRGVAIGAVIGLIAGVVIALTGGRLMGGSLVELARHFPQSHLRLDAIGGLFGEGGFGPLSQGVVTALEAALFTACVVGAIRRGARSPSP